MSVMQYPDIASAAMQRPPRGSGRNAFRAVLFIGGGSVLLWSLVIFATWRLV